jgi:hypothetical protein
MVVLIILGILTVAFIGLSLYACCVAASIDDRERERTELYEYYQAHKNQKD